MADLTLEVSTASNITTSTDSKPDMFLSPSTTSLPPPHSAAVTPVPNLDSAPVTPITSPKVQFHYANLVLRKWF